MFYPESFSSIMNTKGYLRTSGVKVIIKCCCFYLLNYLAYEYYVMYGFVLVSDRTIHFINVLNTERAKRARKKYICSAIDLH